MGAESEEHGAGSGERAQSGRCQTSAVGSQRTEVGGGRAVVCLSKVVGTQSASLDDAFERADWDRLVAMHGDNYLPAVRMAPFLVAGLSTSFTNSAFVE